VLRATNDIFKTPNIKMCDELDSVSFVSMSMTSGLIANCANLKLAAHVEIDSHIHLTPQCLYDARQAL
jgi:hypothetical protein